MYRIFFSLLIIAAAMPVHAITWKYGSFHATYKTCKLTGWSGNQPTSGKLTVPSTYTHTDGVTYTVNNIASGALNDLTEVTEITIPATIKVIGKAEGGNPTPSFVDTANGVSNFQNCPKLTAFKVASGNTKFAATGAGILASKDMRFLYRVPQAIELSSGDLNISSKVVHFMAGCFNGNTTAETMTIPAVTHNISEEAGIYEMKKLAKIIVAQGNDDYHINGGALIREDYCLIAYPPARTIQNVEITDPIDRISDYAFANTKHLKSLALPSSLRDIGDYSFYKSSITKISLPDGLEYIGQEAFSRSALTSVTLPKGWNGSSPSHIFAYCKQLTTITVNRKDATIPSWFALGCTALKTVKFPNGLPNDMGNAAFKDCTSLTSFPISLSTWYVAADSVFANTGFTKIAFDKSGMEDAEVAKEMFSGSKELAQIDFSAVTLDKNFDGVHICPEFVSNAPKLKTIKFPDATVFSNYSDDEYFPSIGPGVPLEKVVIKTFSRMYDPVVMYSGVGKYSPKTYVKTTNQQKYWWSYNSCPLKYLYGSTDGAEVTPIFYCEAYKPLPGYEVADATYYVPGLCAANYDKAAKKGSSVVEIYSISAVRLTPSNNISVTVKPIKSGVTINTVAFNDENVTAPDADGVVNPKFKYRDVNTIRVAYTVNGEKMETLYPIEAFENSSADDVLSDKNQSTLSFKLNGRDILMSGSAMTPTYHIFDASGSQVMEGSGSSVDLSTLLPGLYVIQAVDGNSCLAEKFMLK